MKNIATIAEMINEELCEIECTEKQKLTIGNLLLELIEIQKQIEAQKLSSGSVQQIVIQHLDKIINEYLEHYGCESCWSDDHQCTCSHDKTIIRQFIMILKNKLKDVV